METERDFRIFRLIRVRIFDTLSVKRQLVHWCISSLIHLNAVPIALRRDPDLLRMPDLRELRC